MFVYFLVRWVSIFGETGYIRWYFTDLLFVPAMSTVALIGVRYLKKDWQLLIPWRYVFLQALIVSVYFEWYLPESDPKYTADPWDSVMYIVGAFIFLRIQKHL